MLVSQIYKWAITHPNKTALISNGIKLSYAGFAKAIESSRSLFGSHNLLVGRTAIIIANVISDAWIIALSLRAQGLYTICVQTISQAEALKICNVAYIVITHADQGAGAGRAFAEAKVITVSQATFASVKTDAALRPFCDMSLAGGHILYTSGTTGTYKKVLRKGEDEMTRHTRMATALGFTKDTVRHSCDFGLWTAASGNSEAIWHVGGCVVIDQRKNRWSNFFSHRINSSFLTSAMLAELLQVDCNPLVENSRCEFMIGGGFMPAELASEAIARLGVEVSAIYSSTECSNILRSRFRKIDDSQWLSEFEGRSVQIVDEEGKECSVGKQGELRVLLLEGDCAGYMDDESASAKFFRDGYFYPGDMASRRSDGKIRILGRVGDVLNLQGKKVANAPIELWIRQLLGVDAVCLFSGLSDEGKEELVIAIETKRIILRNELERIAQRFKSFGRVRFQVMNEFPRTNGGMKKIRRTELRMMIFGN